MSSNISDLISEQIADISSALMNDTRDKLAQLPLVTDDLNKISSSVLTCLSVGDAVMMITLVLSCSLVYGYPLRLRRYRDAIGARFLALLFFAMGLMCCSPFVMLVGAQAMVFSKARSPPLSSWVVAERGRIFDLSVVSLVSSIVFTIVCTRVLLTIE